MSDDAAVVWLGDVTAREDAARALSEWARARGVRLSSTDAITSPPPAVDAGVADRVEKELDRAREAVAALDADTAERALARAEALLRAHPELPQAAWLRAEVERGFSARYLRVEPRDEARAREAWQRAWALDGGRLAGVGETDLGPRKRAEVVIRVHGVHGRSVDLVVDGEHVPRAKSEGDVERYTVALAPAEHHVVASLDGAVAFASWVAIAPGSETVPPIDLSLSAEGGCSRGAFASVARDGSDVRARGVTCGSWVAAIPGDRPSSVLVARCAAETCGPLLEWRVDRLMERGPPQALGPHTPWPAWATWTLVGIGAAAATSVTLIATGVFESRPIEQRFVSGGARVE